MATQTTIADEMSDEANEDRRRIDAGPNLLLMRRIRAAGVATTAELARRLVLEGTPVHQTVLSLLCRGKLPGRRRDGLWHDHARHLADLLGCDPEDLFDVAHQCHPDDPMLRADVLRHYETERIADAQVESPDDVCARKELECAIANALMSLSPMEERVIRSRFGIGILEKTYIEIGDEFSVSLEQIRRIEAKALRKLKHPARTGPLKAAAWGWLPKDDGTLFASSSSYFAPKRPPGDWDEPWPSPDRGRPFSTGRREFSAAEFQTAFPRSRLKQVVIDEVLRASGPPPVRRASK
ncbi:RNA polymerase sigma factor (sigma-70 family) [Bradyrhizobium sp. USDA 4341]